MLKGLKPLFTFLSYLRKDRNKRHLTHHSFLMVDYRVLSSTLHTYFTKYLPLRSVSLTFRWNLPCPLAITLPTRLHIAIIFLFDLLIDTSSCTTSSPTTAFSIIVRAVKLISLHFLKLQNKKKGKLIYLLINKEYSGVSSQKQV